MEEESKQELRNSMIRGLVEASERAIELIEKHHPEIANKIRAKDVPLKEKISELEKIVRVHVSRKRITIHITGSKEGRI